jgi:hypothetical protein
MGRRKRVLNRSEEGGKDIREGTWTWTLLLPRGE